MNTIKKFVITGGPCGGKSTGLAELERVAKERDYTVIVVPEVARMLISTGVDPRVLTDPAEIRIIQSTIVRLQIELEESAAHFLRFTQGAKRGLIICDRGLCDNGAYMDRADWHTILGYAHTNVHEALKRYSAVFHLQSAAVGAERFYKKDLVRTDTPEQARVLDGLTMTQWDSHPNFHLIVNPHCEQSFMRKMEILVDHVKEELDKP